MASKDSRYTLQIDQKWDDLIWLLAGFLKETPARTINRIFEIFMHEIEEKIKRNPDDKLKIIEQEAGVLVSQWEEWQKGGKSGKATKNKKSKK